MPSWLPTLEKKLEGYAKKGGGNTDFRLYLTADAVNSIPVGILDKCIKLTNEPPAGLKANMKRAWAYFSPESVDRLEQKVRPILFALCYFHSTLLERRKFGPKGWNMIYPFNIGDLRDSRSILVKKMEDGGAGQVPWDDLKYIFGEIMYGGHIVDDWDRILCNAYLDYHMGNDLIQEGFEMFPYTPDPENLSFKTPPIVNYEKYAEHIEKGLDMGETPISYGMHPNAEIGLGKEQCTNLFETMYQLLPREQNTNIESVSTTIVEKADNKYIRMFLEDWEIKTRIFNLEEIKDKIGDEKGPYQNVFL